MSAAAASSSGKGLVVQSSSGTVLDAKSAAVASAAEDAIKRVSAGFDVNHWFLNETKKPVKRELFCWYTPPAAGTASIVPVTTATLATADLGAFTLCDRKLAASDAKARVADPTSIRIPVHEVTELYFGARIQIFASMAVGSSSALIPENRCFSILSQSVTLSGETMHADDVQAITTAVTHVSRLAGKRIVINDKLGPKPNPDDADTKSGGGEAVAVKSITLKVRKALLVVDPRMADDYVIDKSAIMANADVCALASDGFKLTIYEMGPNRIARKRVAVCYYDVSWGAIGSLIVSIPAVLAKAKGLASAPDSKSGAASDEIPAFRDELIARPDTTVFDCSALSRVLLGKQSTLLLNPIAEDAVDTNCVSLIGDKTAVCEVAAPKSIDTLVRALKHIVPFAKRELVLDPLKDAFQPTRMSYTIAAKRVPRDSDEENEDGDGDDGDGGDD